MARLYADENFPRQVVDRLRALGHVVLTASEAGNANRRMPDDEVVAFATREQRAVLTINRRDFIALHQANPAHAGIIVCTQDPDTDRQVQRIDESVRPLDSLAGMLIRINREP